MRLVMKQLNGKAFSSVFLLLSTSTNTPTVTPTGALPSIRSDQSSRNFLWANRPLKNAKCCAKFRKLFKWQYFLPLAWFFCAVGRSYHRHDIINKLSSYSRAMTPDSLGAVLRRELCELYVRFYIPTPHSLSLPLLCHLVGWWPQANFRCCAKTAHCFCYHHRRRLDIKRERSGCYPSCTSDQLVNVPSLACHTKQHRDGSSSFSVDNSVVW